MKITKQIISLINRLLILTPGVRASVVILQIFERYINISA